jgi:hypothetical protein
VVAETMAALQQEEAAKEDALQQVAGMQAALQRAQVEATPPALCTQHPHALHSSMHHFWAEAAAPAVQSPC